ncbi:hypothetical protein B0H15DRAFT_854045 [Mycena belliarum]|uniref:Uncharacterized protein n=1 Tax=Mycena belliarum TaxID=1033014 RepID=A0AAD6XQZ0_9AGAR|nr:hypothetical protein B0H15DRAFT_873075 [Mycena belliae]KAJ7081556.1 hypothetical protein B0H15DRAFT_854045 [Mycena belliae]
MRRRVSTDLRPTAGRAASVSRRARPRRPRRSAQGPVPPNFYARALRCAPESTAAALRAQHVVAAQRMPLRSQLDPARHRACADERPLHGRLAPYRAIGRAASASRRARPHCPRRSAQGPVPPNFYTRALPSPPPRTQHRPACSRGGFVPRASPASSLDTGLAQRNGRPTYLVWRRPRPLAPPPASRLDYASAPPRSACSPRLMARASRSSGSGALALRASPSLARRKSSAAARAPSEPASMRARPSQRPPPAGSPASAARVTDLGCRRANPPPLAPRAVYLQRYIPGARLTLPATACSALPPPSRPLHPPAPGPRLRASAPLRGPSRMR